MTSARADILEGIRGRLQDRLQAAGDSTRQEIGAPKTTRDLDPARAGRFEDQLERARATWVKVADRSSVPAAVTAYLEGAGLQLQAAVAAGLRDLEWGNVSILDPSEADYALDGIAIATECHYGIAETGTLVSLSNKDLDAKLNFLAETHIVVLAESKVVERPEDLWAVLRTQGEPSFMPWAVHFITGPSRTADIEQTIELGAHGPRSLHVILVAG